MENVSGHFWYHPIPAVPAVPAVPGSLGLAETSIHLVQQLADLHETRRLDRWKFSRWFFKAQFGKLMINQLLEKMGQLDVKILIINLEKSTIDVYWKNVVFFWGVLAQLDQAFFHS